MSIGKNINLYPLSHTCTLSVWRLTSSTEWTAAYSLKVAGREHGYFWDADILRNQTKITSPKSNLLSSGFDHWYYQRNVDCKRGAQDRTWGKICFFFSLSLSLAESRRFGRWKEVWQWTDLWMVGGNMEQHCCTKHHNELIQIYPNSWIHITCNPHISQ